MCAAASSRVCRLLGSRTASGTAYIYINTVWNGDLGPSPALEHWEAKEYKGENYGRENKEPDSKSKSAS